MPATETPPRIDTYENRYGRSRHRFEQETRDHTLTILRDDGLYRHLRCARPDSYTYGFDIVTWPGYLAIVGDAGDWVFSRTRDMFEFFADGSAGRLATINPDYWSEKLQAPDYRSAKKYDDEAYTAHVEDWFKETSEDMDDAEKVALRRAVDEQLLDDWLGWRDSEYEAYRLLRDFDHADHHFYDTDEWSLRKWDWSFLWCCHAILWAIGEYRKKVKPHVDGKDLTDGD